jgi:hypothetical protein
MDADRLAAAVQEGELNPLAERAAMAELAGRVLADGIDDRGRGQTRMDRAVTRVTVGVAVVVLGIWLARTFGLFR